MTPSVPNEPALIQKSAKFFNEDDGIWMDKNPTGFDTAFNDLLPIFEYVDTATHLMDVAKFGKTTALGNMLSSVLIALLEKSQAYREFRNKFNELFASEDSEVRVELNKISSQVTIYIGKQFPDCINVSFQIAEPAFEELLKGCSTEVDDGVATDSSEKGDGMQRALMLAILQTYADFRKKNEATGKNFIFFIDEAELHLHPTAQRYLKNALKDIVDNGDQVFLNTHSSVLVVDDFPEQKIFRVEKIEKKSEITEITAQEKPSILFELLGGSPQDLLLPRNFLIVEGRSDYEFIRTIIQRFYATKPVLQIVFSEGDHERQRRSMDAINVLFAPLAQNPVYRNRLVILCDAPHPDRHADFEGFRQSYSFLDQQRQLHILPTQSLEEYYPGEFRKTPNDVEELGKRLYLKRQLALNAGKSITQEDFEMAMPVLHAALTRCWEQAHA